MEPLSGSDKIKRIIGIATFILALFSVVVSYFIIALSSFGSVSFPQYVTFLPHAQVLLLIVSFAAFYSKQYNLATGLNVINIGLHLSLYFDR